MNISSLGLINMKLLIDFKIQEKEIEQMYQNEYTSIMNNELFKDVLSAIYHYPRCSNVELIEMIANNGKLDTYGISIELKLFKFLKQFRKTLNILVSDMKKRNVKNGMELLNTP